MGPGSRFWGLVGKREMRTAGDRFGVLQANVLVLTLSGSEQESELGFFTSAASVLTTMLLPVG